MQASKDFDYQALYGDIHNHCNISYAHGSLDDAIKNAALRLDFASITGHASWPDMDEHAQEFSISFNSTNVVSPSYIKTGTTILRGYLKQKRRIRSFYFQATRFIRMSIYTIVGLKPSTKMILADSPSRTSTKNFQREP